MTQQISDLVINLDVDSASFTEQIPRIKNLLTGMADTSELSSQRMARFAERQAQAMKEMGSAGEKAALDIQEKHTAATTAMTSDWQKASQALEDTENRVTALSQKLAENQAKSAENARQQDAATEAFFQQIDAVNRLSGETQSLTAIQAQLRHARTEGNISQQDYLALVSRTTAREIELRREEEKSTAETHKATQAKNNFIQSLTQQAATFKASKSDILEYQAALNGASSEAAPLIAQIRQMEFALENEAAQNKLAAQAAREKAAADRQAAAEAKRTEAAQKSFIDSLKSQTDAIGKTQLELLELKAAQMGVSAQSAPFIAKLREQESAWKTGAISAGQYKQAMRMLPAQFTDIATSIAGGMPLWLILMQQGGQISDSFGGVGNIFEIIRERLFGVSDASDEASDSLSDSANGLAENAENAGKLSSILSPTKVGILALAAVVGTLTYAWYKGSKEQYEFSKSLIMTGNQAGMTSGQLADMARMVAESTSNPTAVAAEALNRVVSGGKIAKSALQSVTESVVAMNDATGESIDSLVSEFERIAKNPVAAISELNDKYRFLTLATYNQVKALQDEGNQQEAARIATESYAATMKQRSEQIQESLGTLQKAWKWLGDAAKGAWDSMLDIGREVSIEQRILDATAELDRAETNLAKKQKGQTENAGPYGNWKSDELRRETKARDVAKERLESLISEKVTQDVLNSSISDYESKQQKSIAAQQDVNELIKDTLSNEEKRIKAQDALTRKIKEGAVISKEDEARVRKNINDKFKDPVVPKGKAYTPPAGIKAEDSAQADLLALQAQLETLKEHKSVNDVISQQRKDLWNYQAKINILQQAQDGPLKRQLSAKEQSLLASSQQTLALKEQLALLGDQITAQEQLNKRNDSSQKYVNQMAEKQAALKASSTLSDRESGRESVYAQLRSGWQNAGGSLDDQGYKQQLDAAKSYFAEEDKLRGDWKAGAQKSWADYSDAATNTYEQVKSASSSALNGVSSYLTSVLTTGKASFKDFTKSILSMLTEILIKMQLVNGVNSVIGMFGGGGVKANANGGVYNSASLSAYSGSIVDKPTFFAFANGGGVMGEAGPEAILPLRRGANGKLGVVAGNAGGGSPVFHNTIILQSDGTATSKTSGGTDATSQAMMKMLDKFCQDHMLKALRPGGMLFNAMRTR
ncbi:phage tail tape measure protein [Klebsiella sp. BIGb0407]|uniref:phage tail tape measure protein n=1 Tax=Klebsiella sp. BIGb0407 TaxID=2940603 RepID=UPI00216A2299|nr:phage tail tape measure protein [Klebsiella sp. BIGb0407]MCS3433705.1 lambda family phage tail tape measure protein [Klebsiella sp. BIGb0407]